LTTGQFRDEEEEEDEQLRLNLNGSGWSSPALVADTCLARQLKRQLRMTTE